MSDDNKPNGQPDEHSAGPEGDASAENTTADSTPESTPEPDTTAAAKPGRFARLRASISKVLSGSRREDQAQRIEPEAPDFSTITPDDDQEPYIGDMAANEDLADDPDEPEQPDHTTDPLNMLHATLVAKGMTGGVDDLKSIERTGKASLYAETLDGKRTTFNALNLEAHAVNALNVRIQQLNAHIVTDFLEPKMAKGTHASDIENIKFPRSVIALSMDDGSSHIIDLSNLPEETAQSYITGIKPLQQILTAKTQPQDMVDTLEMLKTTLKADGNQYRLKDIQAADILGEDRLRLTMRDGKTHNIRVLNLDKNRANATFSSAQNFLAQYTAEFLQNTLPEGTELADIKKISTPKNSLLLKMRDEESPDQLIDVSNLSKDELKTLKARTPAFLTYKDNLGPLPKSSLWEKITGWWAEKKYARAQCQETKQEKRDASRAKKAAINGEKTPRSWRRKNAEPTTGSITEPGKAPNGYAGWRAYTEEEKRIVNGQLRTAAAIAAQNAAQTPTAPAVQPSAPANDSAAHDGDTDTTNSTTAEAVNDHKATPAATPPANDGDTEIAQTQAPAAEPVEEPETAAAVDEKQPAATAASNAQQSATREKSPANNTDAGAPTPPRGNQRPANTNNNVVHLAFNNGTNVQIATQAPHTIRAAQDPDGTIHIAISPAFAQSAKQPEATPQPVKPAPTQQAETTTRDAAGKNARQITADSKYAQAFAKVILEQEVPDLKLHNLKNVTSDGVNGLVLEMNNGSLRNLKIDMDETQFQNTHDLALAINLAKQNQTRAEEEEMWAKYDAEHLQSRLG